MVIGYEKAVTNSVDALGVGFRLSYRSSFMLITILCIITCLILNTIFVGSFKAYVTESPTTKRDTDEFVHAEYKHVENYSCKNDEFQRGKNCEQSEYGSFCVSHAPSQKATR